MRSRGNYPKWGAEGEDVLVIELRGVTEASPVP